MKNKIYQGFLWLSTIALLVSIIFLPDVVPMHFGLDGKVDSYGSKYFLIIVYLLPIIIYYGMNFSKRIDPRREKLERNKEAYEIMKIIISFFFIIISGFLTYMMLNPTANVQMGVCIIVGILLIASGNYMPRIPQNYMLGIKTPWGFANEEVWNKTQRVGGYGFVGTGVIVIIAAFLPSIISITLIIITMLVVVLGVSIYSYLLYKKEQ